VRDWAAVDGALPGQHFDEEHERRPEHDLDDARHGLRRAGGCVDGGETGPMQAVRRAQTSFDVMFIGETVPAASRRPAVK